MADSRRGGALSSPHSWQNRPTSGVPQSSQSAMFTVSGKPAPCPSSDDHRQRIFDQRLEDREESRADRAVDDVVLCRVSGSQYLHLILAIKENGSRFQIGNNRGGINGWISRDAIFGRLVRIEP